MTQRSDDATTLAPFQNAIFSDIWKVLSTVFL